MKSGCGGAWDRRDKRWARRARVLFELGQGLYIELESKDGGEVVRWAGLG
jgi:hypothetical protein